MIGPRSIFQSRNRTRLAFALPVVLLAFAALPTERRVYDSSEGRVYDSDEHRLIGDLGAAQVVVPASVQFPPGLKLVTPENYFLAVRNAKITAVGFATNKQSDYNDKKKKVQDNCYWRGFGQREYNFKIYIPDASLVPSQVLHVPTYTSSSQAIFTFGELVSVYGDYRRTTYCGSPEKCFLTDANVAQIQFARGTPRLRWRGFCPDPLASHMYLRFIGSGLVPPFGSGGNTVSNTANDDEYGEAGWWGDEMLRIANVNDWHFSSAAVAWYVGLHRLALLYVDSARVDPRYWIKALHHEANALHSLTDLFAFGHVVTNRDETSHAIMRAQGLLDAPAYHWMENVISMGGGIRADDGRVGLSTTFPPISAAPGPRKDFMKSYRGTWAARAKAELEYHNEFNARGAQVKNLRGETFYIYGDAKLHDVMVDSKSGGEFAAAAVAASVQSLFDAYVALQDGSGTLSDIGSAGSSFFAALTYVPIYVDYDPNKYFLGRWVLYAKAADAIAGTGVVPAEWEACSIPYLSGKDWGWPPVQTEACAVF